MNLGTALGTWGAPPDLPAKVAVALAAVAVGLAFVRRSPVLHEGTERRFLGIASVAAGVLSIAYISSYLHGGPRIIDATTYFLQGRALSHGDFAWTPLEPTAEFRGRFLVYDASRHTLGGIFPPGYPLLLAFGFVLGAPMIIGPAIAAALVVATYRLARAMDLAVPHARAAALLSIACVALRYHTADTMSHGATALGVALALERALRKRAALAWLAVGYVFATRPISAVPIGLVVGALTFRCRHSARSEAEARVRVWGGAPTISALLGLVPGVALLLLSQRAVAGSFWASAQRLYYTLSDGPSGCFRYGFGAGTGCVFEHGDFVHARLEHGYGLLQALGTTLRRLHHHLLDVANFEPLAFLVVIPIAKRVARPASALIGLQVLAYLPFYFDGDYPGGGARFFADVLPIEHVLVVLAVTLLVRSDRVDRALHFVVALSLVGFAVHAAFEHGKLRDRDGGHPWFEKEVLTHASITQGLVFIDSDHGFALAHDPEQRIETGVVVARRRGDDRDRMLYENLGRPPTFWYRFEPDGKIKEPLTVAWAPPEHGERLRFEAEAEWPALAQSHGFAVPGWTHACASEKRALVLTPDDGQTPATADIELPVPAAGEYELTVAVANARIPWANTQNAQLARGKFTLPEVPSAPQLTWDDPKDCASLAPVRVTLTPPAARVTLEASGGPVAVDALYLRSLRTP